MAGEATWIMLAMLLVVAYYIMQKRKNYPVGSGGEIKNVDWEGYTASWGQQDKPELIDINTERRYKITGYKEVTQVPYVVSVRMEPVGTVTTNNRKEIKYVEFEQGVNEPLPVSHISCCIPNQPGAWFFSETGEVSSPQPLAQRIIEDKNREIEKLQNDLRRQDADKEIKVKDALNMLSRFSTGMRPPMAPPMM